MYIYKRYVYYIYKKTVIWISNNNLGGSMAQLVYYKSMCLDLNLALVIYLTFFLKGKTLSHIDNLKENKAPFNRWCLSSRA